jgi:hypothetical protein
MTSINLFSKWEATISIRLFDRANFSGLSKSSLSKIKKKKQIDKKLNKLVFLVAYPTENKLSVLEKPHLFEEKQLQETCFCLLFFVFDCNK